MNNILSIKNGYLPNDAGSKSAGEKSLQNTAEKIRRWMADSRRQKIAEAASPHKRFTANHLLESLSNNELAKLLPFLERVEFAGDEYVYQPDDAIEFIYFPETAVMSEFQILEDGRTVEIAMTGREGVIGLSAIFNGQHAANWTQISVAGTALKINTLILKDEFICGGELHAAFLDYINNYIGQISQRVICNSYHTVEQRFCSWLLMLQDRNKNPRVPMTQEQIARLLGVHRPSVTQIAQTLRRKKIINYIRGKISITDREKLENSACECYGVIHKIAWNVM
ncbi:MAG TPA: Crp/Fnr family transcriptional regulator [Pyrinomonadaceae bacterium]|jgi:CRP-like cAMP-binding protein